MMLPETPTGIVEKLEEFERRLPTQKVRSEEQISTQHFSTPLALAWLVSPLAAIGDDDIVLEPSAGVGLLATWADRDNAACINEIDPVRPGLLRHQLTRISIPSFN